jgi:hypothetical protein
MSDEPRTERENLTQLNGRAGAPQTRYLSKTDSLSRRSESGLPDTSKQLVPSPLTVYFLRANLRSTFSGTILDSYVVF